MKESKKQVWQILLFLIFLSRLIKFENDVYSIEFERLSTLFISELQKK
jgi:hypothetical protein